jgi:hypothetical protein
MCCHGTFANSRQLYEPSIETTRLIVCSLLPSAVFSLWSRSLYICHSTSNHSTGESNKLMGVLCPSGVGRLGVWTSFGMLSPPSTLELIQHSQQCPFNLLLNMIEQDFARIEWISDLSANSRADETHESMN